MTRQVQILIIILISCFQLLSQDRTIDSLKQLLKTDLNDTTRCSILAQLVELEPDDNVWPVYNQQVKEMCEKYLKNSPSADPKKQVYLRLLSGAINNMGYLANLKGEISKALEYFKKTLELKEQIGDKTGAAVCLSNIGYVYDNQGDIPKALDYYSQSLKIQEQIGDKKGQATTLNNLGTVYDEHGDDEMAIKYYNMSLKLHEETGNKSGIGIALNNIGFVYEKQKNIAMANEYYSRCLKYRQEGGDEVGMATTLSNLGFIHKAMGDTARAEEDYRKSLAISEHIEDKEGICITLNNLCTTRLQQGKISEAKAFGEKGFAIANELGFPIKIRDLSRSLANVYALEGNWKKAYDMQTLFKVMSDSVNNEKNKKASIQKAFQYEYEKKTAADSLRTAEERKVHTVQMKAERTQRFALYGGLLLVFGFLVFIFNRFRVTQKQKQIIEEQKLKVSHAYEQLNEKNKEVLDSIYYARRIQRALITNEKYFSSHLNRLRQTQ